LLPFVYERADREAWPTPPPGHTVLIADSASIALFSSQAELRISRSEFPDLPPPFTIDECVEVGLALLADAMQMPRHVLKFGLAYRSLLEAKHEDPSGKVKRLASIAAHLNIDPKTLDDFGKHCTHGGEGAEARAHKHGRRTNRIPFTNERREWVFRVLRELIKRQGRFAAGAVPSVPFADPCPGLDRS
jgi:hypothetical protein